MAVNVVPLRGIDLPKQIGSLLMYAEEPVSVQRLGVILETSEDDLNCAIDKLNNSLEYVGLTVKKIGNNVSLIPNPANDYYLKRYKETTEDQSLNVVKEYLNAKKISGMRDKTAKTYKYTLDAAMKSLGKTVENIDAKDIRKYLTDASDAGNKPITIHGKISVLKSFFKWLEREDYIDKNPMRKIDKPKIPKPAAKYLTVEQIEQLRETATGRDAVLLETLYSAGLRVSEAVNLDWDHIDFNQKLLNVYNGKGGKDRQVPLSVKACRTLVKHKNERKDDDPFVFRSNYKRRMSKETIERRVKQLGEKAGLKVTVTPHKFRHSLGTHLLDRGMKLEEVQVILGHEEIKTTQIYARTQFANVEHNYRKFMP